MDTAYIDRWPKQGQLQKLPKKNFFPNSIKQFANIVTNDETWVHYFELVKEIGNE